MKDKENKIGIGEIISRGAEVPIRKKYCKVEGIDVHEKNLNGLKNDEDIGSCYLGKLIIPGNLLRLKLPVIYNDEYDFIYSILAGEDKRGYCNLTLNSPIEENNSETRAIKDIKTASTQIFCAYTDLPIPERDGGGNCSSCKHQTKKEVVGEEGKVNRKICKLDGLILDHDWHKFKKYIESKNIGQIGKKEKSTITYEHQQESPYPGARKGRYANKYIMKERLSGEGDNCPYYAPWFYHDKDDKWITGESRRLPWEEDEDGAKVIGSEVIVDCGEYLDNIDSMENVGGDSEMRLDNIINSLDLDYSTLRKLADTGESKEVIRETIKLLAQDINEEELEVILEAIVSMRD